jgi:hypothetical protein
MTEQSKMTLLVKKFLQRFHTHPITIAEALSKDNYKKSFQLIMENPHMTKEEFLEKMGIEDWE